MRRKLKNIVIAVFLFLIGANVTFAAIKLNVSIIYKWGIDTGLVLVSELHSIEDVEEDKIAVIEMKNGFRIEVSGKFVDDENAYGPGDLVQISGKIYVNGKEMKDTFFNNLNLIHLDESKTFSYREKSGQLIEVTIVPRMK